MRPFTRYLLQPVAGAIDEFSCPPAFAVELVRGAQRGVRLGLGERSTESFVGELSIPFDKDRASVPADGQERIWIEWPSELDSTRALELAIWHIGDARYARDDGETIVPAKRVLEIKSGTDGTLGAGNTRSYPAAGSYQNVRKPPVGEFFPLVDGDVFVGYFSGQGVMNFIVQLWAQLPGSSAFHLVFTQAATSWSSTGPTIIYAYVDITGVPVPFGPYRWDLINTSGVQAITQLEHFIGLKQS